MINKKFLLPNVNKHSALPVANQLARQLTWLIADGVIIEGEKLPTIREYAEVLDIHHHTVRAAYHMMEDQKLVSIKPRIGTIVQKYIPFTSSENQDYLNSEMIAILVPSISDFYQQVVAGIESVALDSKLIPVVLTCHEDPFYAETMYKNLSARGIKGIINISVGFSDEFYVNFRQKENLDVPLVFLDVVDAGTHSMTIDTPAAIELATNHLFDHGYDELAFINCPIDWPIGREALKGFRKAFETRGMEFTQTTVFNVPDFGYSAGRFVIERMIKDHTLPRAIVTVSDNLAIGAISALKENGLQVPQDIAIIGYNDISPSALINPRLSTIALPLFEMGRQTMLALNKIMKGTTRNWIQKVFSSQLVIRESCGCQNSMDIKGEKS